VPGLAAPARVVTDRFGIPHLAAATRSDLYFVWGYVDARDRLWQLVLGRQAARGELWRWLGNQALRGDGGAQLFELGTRADRIWARERARGEIREDLERYAAGVNAYIERCRGRLEPWPAELQQLRIRPRDWRPEDSIAILLGFGITLDLSLPELAEGDSVRLHGARWLEHRRRFENDWIYRTIPDSAARRLYGGAVPPGRPRGRSARGARAAVVGSRPAVRDSHGSPSASLAALGSAALGPWLRSTPIEPVGRASNVFAVGGRRSASGFPLLANDVHLALATPGPFHIVHLTVPGVVDAAGASVPGLPAIVSGRNARVAWGVTALSADVMDLYADTLSRDGRRVLFERRWVPLREAGFTMCYRVLGVPLPLLGQKRRYTPHGPVVALDHGRHIAYAVRWAGSDDEVTLRRLVGVERSASASEVAERFRSLVRPTLNVVAADREGHVVYQAAGALPRRGFVPGLGPLPDDGRHEWRGLIRPQDMPAWNAPPAGFVVNANNLPVGPPYPVELPRFDWVHDRAARIAQRLQTSPRVTIAGLASVQNDVFSRGAERLVPRLLRLADAAGMPLSPGARAALDTLRAWDFRARLSRTAPTLYRGWYGAFLRRSRLEGLPGLAAAALDGRAPDALRSPGTEALEPASRAAVEALTLGLDVLAHRLGPEPGTWTWARAHRARFEHRLVSIAPGLEPAPISVEGDNSTPCAGPSLLPWSTTVDHGPVWRHLVDLAVTDSSLAVVPPGNAASGRHRLDQLMLWARHRYVPLFLSWEKAERAAESVLTLAPDGRR